MLLVIVVVALLAGGIWACYRYASGGSGRGIGVVGTAFIIALFLYLFGGLRL